MIRRACRFLGIAVTAGLLAACSSGGDSTSERLGPILQDSIFGGPIFGDDAPAPKPPVFTRAQLNEVPFATIAVKDDEGNRSYVVPVADNGGYLMYQDANRRGLVMRGGLITATQGFPYNMTAVRHAVEDPIVVQKPVAQWPVSVFRNYQFNLRGGAKDFEITTSCRFELGPRERIEIVELFFDTVRITETCSNAVRSFSNTYWADPANGFIWRSEQWIGPRQDPVSIEIIRPYRAS